MSGGNHRGRVHGGVWPADAQRDCARAGGGAHVAGSPVCSPWLHDSTQALGPTETAHWDAHRYVTSIFRVSMAQDRTSNQHTNKILQQICVKGKGERTGASGTIL